MFLEDIILELNEAKKKHKQEDFPAYIQALRTSMGLTQSKTSEYLCISSNRLKNLENGCFTQMPSKFEISQLASFYDVKPTTMDRKALEFVRKNKRAKKNIRTKILEKNYDYVYPMSQRET